MLACRWGPWLLVLWPMAALAGLIQQYAVNAPFMDDFMTMRLFDKAAHGGVPLSDFFAPQMEHRIAWVRLVALTLRKAWPSHYFISQVWLSFVWLCLTLVNVVILLRQTKLGPWDKTWPLALLAALALFSPVQFGVIFWPVNHQLVGLAFFLASALAVWQAPWPAWLRFFLALLCALAATLSLTSGFLLWLVLVPVIWWCAPMKDRRTRMFATGAWLLAFGITAVLFFHGLKNEADPAFSLGQEHVETMSRNIGAFLSNPWKSLSFAARILGGFLMRGSNLSLMDASLEAGLFLMAVYASCLAYFVWRFRDVELRRRMLPWLAMGAYALGTAFSISLGRMWYGITGAYALHTRYVLHAAPLLLSLPVLVWMIGHEIQGRIPKLSPLVSRVLMASGMALVCLHVLAWNYGERLVSVWSSARIRGAVSTMFYRTACPVENGFGDLPELGVIADDLGLLKPPMLKNLRLDNFPATPSPLNEQYAALSSLLIEKEEDGFHAVANGHAILKRYRRVVDGIFFTYRAADGHWEIFHVTHVNGLPLYLEDTYVRDLDGNFEPPNGMTESLSAFEAHFKLDELPKGVTKVAAWAYDYDTRRVSLIPGIFEVDTTQGTAKPLGHAPVTADLGNDLKRIQPQGKS
jgi:hypothetical protein